MDSTIDAFDGVGISWSGTEQAGRGEPPPPVFTVGNNDVRPPLLPATLEHAVARRAPWRVAHTDDPAAIAHDVARRPGRSGPTW